MIKRLSNIFFLTLLGTALVSQPLAAMEEEPVPEPIEVSEVLNKDTVHALKEIDCDCPLECLSCNCGTAEIDCDCPPKCVSCNCKASRVVKCLGIGGPAFLGLSGVIYVLVRLFLK